ncbi:organic solvent ABC transporter substrate-binding protein [Patiriisocius marinistellae]|uniref:Organic solvent ABC transporter substrate-binding protein n=1 Tax=Patiriisocius marinistellae TaxID=2494560 RepID=A0A5J4G1F8_9FLAO|nr:MlaD family protein [Patiriisocius marinistellae]GEQ86469.1 organic solvent ABC transporter substrate-binding protein [Patiriisocius marinistellae]
MRLSREVKTGILAIGAILLFIFGYSYLKGTNLLEKTRTFYVKYDNVEGLAKSAPVTVNGLIIGKVTDIDYVSDTGKLVVEFSVEEEEFQFSKQSTINIYSTGLIGGKALSIVPEYASRNMAQRGDTLLGSSEDGMLTAVTKALGPLEKKVNGTLATMDSLLISFTKLLDDETREDLQGAIKKLNATMGSLNGASNSLDGLLRNNSDKLDRTFTNLDEMAVNFNQLSDSLAQLETGKLVTEFQTVISRFESIASGLENGEGSVGKLLKDDKLYENLEGASRQLEQLLQDVKLNPKRYVHISVFGKKNKEYNTPDDPDQ